MNEEKLIYIVDDEPDILELVDIHLKKAGFATRKFEDTTELLTSIEKKNPTLIILDLMLPYTDGFEFCKRLKRDSDYLHIPIIMLTAKTEEMDRVLGLELGADDYVTKPFSPRELVARVKAVIRRTEKRESAQDIITYGNLLKIDLNKYQVYVEDRPVNLTTTEFKIIQILSSHRGWVFSRDQILDFLWGNEKIVIDRTIDVHINHLRKKLGEAGKLVSNVRGIGYKLEWSTE